MWPKRWYLHLRHDFLVFHFKWKYHYRFPSVISLFLGLPGSPFRVSFNIIEKQWKLAQSKPLLSSFSIFWWKHSTSAWTIWLLNLAGGKPLLMSLFLVDWSDWFHKRVVRAPGWKNLQNKGKSLEIMKDLIMVKVANMEEALRGWEPKRLFCVCSWGRKGWRESRKRYLYLGAQAPIYIDLCPCETHLQWTSTKRNSNIYQYIHHEGECLVAFRIFLRRSPIVSWARGNVF